jgi:hypothetical protein
MLGLPPFFMGGTGSIIPAEIRPFGRQDAHIGSGYWGLLRFAICVFRAASTLGTPAPNAVVVSEAAPTYAQVFAN